MISVDMLKEELEQAVRFLRSQLVDPLGKDSVDKEALPAGDGIGPDDRMDSAQMLADVLWGTSVLSKGGIGLACDVDEILTDMGGSETFKEGLICGGKAVICLISGCPEGVTCSHVSERTIAMLEVNTLTTDLGKGPDLKSGVVRRVGFKGNIRML